MAEKNSRASVGSSQRRNNGRSHRRARGHGNGPRKAKETADGPEKRPTRTRTEQPVYKVVIRRLPPTLPEQVLRETLKPYEQDFEWSSFEAGKVVSSGERRSRPSRCYISFRKPEGMRAFVSAYDGHRFIGADRQEFRAQVMRAPLQRVPDRRAAPRSRDKLTDTLDDDDDYKAFVAALATPAPLVEDKDIIDPANTPLIEYIKEIRAKQEAKNKAKAAKKQAEKAKDQEEKRKAAQAKADAAAERAAAAKKATGKGKSKDKSAKVKSEVADNSQDAEDGWTKVKGGGEKKISKSRVEDKKVEEKSKSAKSKDAPVVSKSTATKDTTKVATTKDAASTKDANKTVGKDARPAKSGDRPASTKSKAGVKESGTAKAKEGGTARGKRPAANTRKPNKASDGPIIDTSGPTPAESAAAAVAKAGR